MLPRRFCRRPGPSRRRDANGAKLLAFVYCEDARSAVPRASCSPVTRRRIAANIVKLTELLQRPKHCALNAMAKERLPALHVVALAKNPLSASQLASVRNATGLASAAATFVAAADVVEPPK